MRTKKGLNSGKLFSLLNFYLKINEDFFFLWSQQPFMKAFTASADKLRKCNINFSKNLQSKVLKRKFYQFFFFTEQKVRENLNLFNDDWEFQF